MCWTWFLLGFFGGVWVTCMWVGHMMRKIEASKDRDFKWKCREDGCDFKVESNSMEWTDRLASSHEELHRE